MTGAVRATTASFVRGPARLVVGPVLTPLDRALFRLSGGRLKLSAPLHPSLMRFTIGAKTGLRRETPLPCFPRENDRWYIVGSNFGLERHPAWSANLRANPTAQIHYRDYEKTARRDLHIFHLARR